MLNTGAVLKDRWQPREMCSSWTGMECLSRRWRLQAISLPFSRNSKRLPRDLARDPSSACPVPSSARPVFVPSPPKPERPHRPDTHPCQVCSMQSSDATRKSTSCASRSVIPCAAGHAPMMGLNLPATNASGAIEGSEGSSVEPSCQRSKAATQPCIPGSSG